MVDELSADITVITKTWIWAKIDCFPLILSYICNRRDRITNHVGGDRILCYSLSTRTVEHVRRA